MKIPESSSRQNRRRMWKSKKLKWIRKNKESRCIVMWDCNMEKCRSWRRCTCFRRFSVKKLRFWLLRSESRCRKVDEKSRFAASFCIKKEGITQAAEIYSDNKKTSESLRKFLAASTRIELVFSPWEGDVLTPWPTGHVSGMLNIYIQFVENRAASTRIELVFSPWEGDVLTPWPTGLVNRLA